MTGVATAFWIRQLMPVSGDWYVLTNPECDRWFIDRVVAWALVHADLSVDHVRAIDTRGMPHEDNDGDSYFVLGSDFSPLGLTWQEVYHKTSPSRCLCRDITDLVRDRM
jgi:hypothetical protein